MLAVDPNYQRKGIGAALLVEGLVKADKDGVKTHLTSSVGMCYNPSSSHQGCQCLINF